MQTGQMQFLPFFEGKRQFITPIYQRPYSWTTEQCTQLWNDIVVAGTDETMSGHFVGSIVFIQAGLYQVSKMTTLLVIDGQQRLTTITLLLIALAQCAKTSKAPLEISDQEIYDSYLINKHGKDEQRYKLLLTQSDKEILKQLVDHPERVKATKVTSRLVDNYLFFKEKLENGGIDPQAIYDGISKLLIVEITLDRDHDNPQLIFESMNSTGVDLTQSDLIRNYIFMGLTEEPQQQLYKSYWSPMELFFDEYRSGMSLSEQRGLLFRNNIYGMTDLFDHFMRDYLIVKTRATPPLNKVYASFKKYRQCSLAIPIEDIVADIYHFAKNYVNITLAKDEDEEIRRLLLNIKPLMYSFPISFILEIYNDYSRQRLSREDFIKILNFLETYFFRRIICGLTNMSTPFINKMLQGIEIDKTNYLDNVYNVFFQQNSDFTRTPRDEEFKIALITKDLYTHSQRNYLLSKLENYKRKEFVNIESYTIEHIMPQNITNSEAWKMELGENWSKIHSRLLHTLGNLTLTGYNSELSNRPFQEKRDMAGGFADSPIRLNRSLAKLEHWNEEEIQKRAQSLADLALQIWSVPNLSSQKEKNHGKNLKSAKDKEYTIKDYPYLKGNILTLFDQLRKRIMNLDVAVKEEMKEHNIEYKATTTFARIEPHDKYLKITLEMPFFEINDRTTLQLELTSLSLFDVGTTELKIDSLDMIEDVMIVVRQAFERHWEESIEVIQHLAII